MFIEKIEIENFKAISQIELNFKRGVNLLIGDNGAGKTSILEAGVVALGGYLNGVNGVSAKNLSLSDVKMDTVNLGSVSTSIVYHTPVKINCKLNVENEIYEWERLREDESPKRNTKINKKQGDISKELPVLSVIHQQV